MAQIIRHRRGSLEALSAVTSSLVKGELVIASGSSNLTVTNGSSLVFAVPENGQVQATNRFLVGDAAPNTFAGATYNGLVKGVPYYASGSSTLYLLGTDGNEAINLVGNIQPFSASVSASINALSQSIGSGTIGSSVTQLNAFTASSAIKFANLESTSASVNTQISGINTYTASNDTTNALQTTRIDQLAAATASVNSFTSSADGRLDNLESTSASVNINIANIHSYTSSNDTTNTAQNARLTSLENATGSYAELTGGNVFTGTQVITGSLYITSDLVVQGSSSLQNITASAVSIGTNIVNLNTASPAIRFGGVSVADSGSQAGVSGSLLWDSLSNHWIYVQPSGSGEEYNSAILIAGPKNTGALGSELTITSGSIQVALGENHIGDSIITQNVGATKITIAGGLDVTGTISGSINGIGNVTAFSQSVDSRLDSVEASLGGGGSIGTRVAALEVFSGSQEAKDSTLATYTASVDSRLGQLETNSGSQASQLSNLQSFTGSQETKNSTLSTYTASVDSHISNVNSYTASNDTTNTAQDARLTSLEAFSGSQQSKDSTLATYTASVDSRLNQLSTDSGSQASRLTNIESFTGSQNTKNSTLSTYTASIDVNIANIHTFTSSFGTTFSSSVDSRLDTLEGTGTIQGLGTGNNVTFAKVTTTGDVVVGGDLVVQGNTVTLNTATLIVEDKLITLASGSTSSATADGAGIEIAGAGANFVYQHSTTAFTSSVALIAPSVTSSINLGATAGNSKRIAFRNTNGNLDLVPTASVAGDLLQWNGTDFVMSNTIDGGSF